MTEVKGYRKGVRYSALRCGRCGEELMTMAQAKSFMQAAEKAKRVTFSKWGEALAVRIPAEAVRQYRLRAREKGSFVFEKDGFKILPLST